MARFVQVGEAKRQGYELFIHPTPKLVRQPIPGPINASVFEGRVKKAYEEAIRAYNAKLWIPSAQMCGRALEGITKALLPEEERSLRFYEQLQKFPEYIKLEKTITDLSNGIRKGRNIAAHFDEHMDIDEETASMLIDLLDYIIEFLFVLPEKIEALDAQLKTLGEPGNNGA